MWDGLAGRRLSSHETTFSTEGSLPDLDGFIL
jgi:hypothetical protein